MYHSYSACVASILLLLFLCFFFNDTATTEIYTLSLHDALPIYRIPPSGTPDARALTAAASILGGGGGGFGGRGGPGGYPGGGNSSRLYLKLVQEKELVTNVSCNTDR